MTGSPLPDLQAQDSGSGKYIYPRHGGANTPTSCWFGDPAKCTDPVALPPTPEVRDQINQIFVNAGKALSAYQRRLLSKQSAYDRFVAGDVTALSGPAQRGLQLFIGKAECILCHSGPNFTDSRFHNLGVSGYDLEARTAGSALLTAPADVQSGCFPGIAPNAFCPDPGRNGWQARAAGQCLVDSKPVGGKTATCQRVSWPDAVGRFDVAVDCRSPASDATDKLGDSQCIPQRQFPLSKCNLPVASACVADPLCDWIDGPSPRCYPKSDPSELGQFKTPTLRNVALTYPYMHNGSLFDYGPGERGELPPTDPTPHLRRVVNFYNQGGSQPATGSLDTQIHKLNLTGDEVDAIVEFLKSLTDNTLGSDAQSPLANPAADLTDLSDCPN
jgi:cytochrome c peroxidase